MDIGEQKRVIIVEPEPVQVPFEEPAAPDSVPAKVPARETEAVPVRRQGAGGVSTSPGERRGAPLGRISARERLVRRG